MSSEILNALRSESIYDAVDIGDAGFVWRGGIGDTSTRLFGNANVGVIQLTNLQMAGQMPGDHTFVVQRWYARNNFAEAPSELCDRVKAWANSVSVCFVIGNMPVWRLSLYELFERRPRTIGTDVVPRVAADPFPALVPPRQSFSVAIDQFGSGIDGLRAILRSRQGADYVPRVWIHLDGVRVDMYRDMYRIADQRVASLDKVVNAILNGGKEQVSTEDRITRWLGGHIEDADPENRAQLHAVRDGILEGRHRS